MFLRGRPSEWFDDVAKPCMYRWNKFRWGLESKFMGYIGPWEKRMINEFENCTDDDSDDKFGRERVQIKLNFHI